MDLESAYGEFSNFVEMYIHGYDLVRDLPVYFDDTIFFSADFIIKNLEVEIVTLCIEAVHDGVVGCNATLFLLDIKRGDKNDVGVTMLGD